MSVMEMSHRGKAFVGIAQQAEADLRELLAVPAELQGAVPAGRRDGAVRGDPDEPGGAGRGRRLRQHRRLVEEGDRRGEAVLQGQRRRRCGGRATTRTCRPQAEWKRSADAAYLHYTPNETIGGVEFPFVPDSGDVPLVADMSSTILSRPIDVSRFGVIYAGAQKNIGPAGLVVVIVRDDLLGQRARRRRRPCSTGRRMAADGSMLQHAATFAWYVAGLVFQWLKRQGGLEAMGRAQPAQGAQALRRDRRLRLLPQPGRARLPLVDERAVHAAERGARQAVRRGREAGGPGRRSRATAPSAACAPASTTPCRWRASTRWWSSCASSSAPAAEPCSRS